MSTNGKLSPIEAPAKTVDEANPSSNGETEAVGIAQKSQDTGATNKRRSVAAAPAKKSTAKTASSPPKKQPNSTGRAARLLKRGKTVRPFPAGTFEDSLTFAAALFNFGSGTKVRRLTLFDHLGKAPESGLSRQMIINAGKYGLIIGGQSAEQLELTSEGTVAVSPDTNDKEKRRVQIALGITNVESFHWLYDEYKNKALPAQQVMRDFLETKGVPKEWVTECVDTFILNIKFLGLLKVLSGAERVITIEHLLDELPIGPNNVGAETTVRQSAGQPAISVANSATDFSTTCFYVSPIGDEDSEQRKHSDLFLNFIVAPALSEFGLNIVRADQIGQGGMITRQIIEHLVRSKLVVADLSFHNPNVFYELALRHACRLPTVQLIREGDRIPFDLDQVRTVKIDNGDIYKLVPQMETYKSQIANQVRKALDEGENAENPISVFFPGLSVKIIQRQS